MDHNNRATVKLREEDRLEQIIITDSTKPAVDLEVLSGWQETLNLCANIMNVPAALIMKLHVDIIEAFLVSGSDGNPYSKGDSEHLGAGLYCETVVAKKRPLIISNALEYPKWKDNPDVELNMISYMGMPLLWPDKEVFGTICVLDNTEHEYVEELQSLLSSFRKAIEKDLAALINQQKLIESNLKLEKSNNRYRTFSNAAFDGIVITSKGCILDVNKAACNISGYNEIELIGHDITSLIAPDHRQTVRDKIDQNHNDKYEIKLLSKSGEHIPVEVRGKEFPLGEETARIAAIRDLRETKKLQSHIHIFRELIDNSTDGIQLIDVSTGRILECNRSSHESLGYTKDELLSRTVMEVDENLSSINSWKSFVLKVRENGSVVLEGLQKRKDGTTFPVDIGVRFSIIDGREYFIAIARDITERKKYEEQLELLSVTDHLTQTFNRREFSRRISEEMMRTKRNDIGFSIILFDIDYFKKINDAYGHDAGDSVLVGVVDVCRETIREIDILFRWGGEEFVILLPGTDSQGAAAIAERLRESVEKYKFEKKIELTISLGVTEYVEEDTLDLIVKRADKALYKAKNSGRNSIFVVK